MVVHHQHKDRWDELTKRVGLESAQQLYDHLAQTPDRPPAINRSTILKGKAGKPAEEGFSRTVHYEISGAARIDYQWNREYRTVPDGDPHPVVRIIAITFSSH